MYLHNDKSICIQIEYNIYPGSSLRKMERKSCSKLRCFEKETLFWLSLTGYFSKGVFIFKTRVDRNIKPCFSRSICKWILISVPKVILYLVCGHFCIVLIGVVEIDSLAVGSAAIAVKRCSKLYGKNVPKAVIRHWFCNRNKFQ